MKNVANCDTWCELQNPVNHRVFERKLRPKPLGRGHVCLGVTHPVALPSPRPSVDDSALEGGRILASRALLAVGLNLGPLLRTSRQVVVEILNSNASRDENRGLGVRTTPVASPSPSKEQERLPRLRPQVRRDYPLSLSISISGGKETN